MEKTKRTCKISFEKAELLSREVPEHSNLMRALIDSGLPVASSCGGKGICGKCRMQIVEGKQNLSPCRDFEKETSERNQLERDERLSCQCVILGDIKVSARYW